MAQTRYTYSSRKVAFAWNDRYSETPPEQQMTTYYSPFRTFITHDRFKHQPRSIREIAPATLLALELYIYLFTYTPLTHDEVSVVIFQIVLEVDWEMLAILDEDRDLRVPNVYDARDSVEEEDLWTHIRGLREDRITSSFDRLMERLDKMGFSVTGILRRQKGRRIWLVVWEEGGLPVEMQPMLVHSRFDVDLAATIDESQDQFLPALQSPPARRLVSFKDGPAGQNSPVLDSREHIEVYISFKAGEGHGNLIVEDENDDELDRVLKLSTTEF